MEEIQLPSEDQKELARFRKILNSRTAPLFADNYRLRPEYRMYVFELMTPHGDAVVNDFNFKSEDAVKIALSEVAKLAPIEDA